MTNEQMTANRFGRWYENRKLYAKIANTFKSGHKVQVSTHLKSTVYPSLEWFKCGKTGVYVRRGKNWDCINYCAIRAAA